MNMRRAHILLALLASSVALFGQQPDPNAQQDPPDQPGQSVARLSVINGEASVRRGDSGEWVAAILNAPLMAGDSISVAPGASVEMQLDYANFVRIGGDSEIRISQFDNGRNQIQVSRGIVTWRVLRDSNAQSEISTPVAAVHPLRLAAVRAEVLADGATRIIVRHGDAEVSNARGTELVHEGNMMLLRGIPGDAEFQTVYAPARDGWDTWNDQRDNYLLKSQSTQYVSQDINGAEDLDQYGRWGYDPAYGNVWTPNVPDTWAPYRNGQWVWEDYYGWTWVDYDPWGWAPFHYGSWYFRTGLGWSWFPGPRYGHYWYHPAMVGFFGFGGGLGVGFGFGNVGWIPLAPFEVYHPWYGRGGFGGGRFGVVNNVNITNVYRNARFANGVTAVSTADFQRGAFRNQFAVNQSQLQQASMVRGGVPVAPTASNLRFSERTASTASIPRSDSGNQRFFSRMPASAAPRTSFTQQQAAVRSSMGNMGGSAQPANSGWRRFGEPGPAGGAAAAQPRSFQQSPNPSGAAAGWNRFGSPQVPAPQQRFATPAQSGYAAPAPRSVQVAPQIVQPRPAAPSGGGYRPAPAPSYRSAPQGNRGGGGGGGGGGRPRVGDIEVGIRRRGGTPSSPRSGR